jgi:ketosteroid isomerase-like protein
MKTTSIRIIGIVAILLVSIVIYMLTGCSNQGGNSTSMQTKIDSLQNVIKKMTEMKSQTDANIRRYDSLDMIAFNSKDIKMIGKYYDKDVVINNNNGTQTKGWDNVEKDLKEFFEMWPDMKGEAQVVRIGDGDWVASVDHVTGTFTKPMKMNGKMFKPNGKKIDMNFVSFVRFKNGKIVEEYDLGNDELIMKQLGLEK